MLRLDKVLFILLAVAIAATCIGIGYLMSATKPEDKFTEFYILGPEGKAENYPQQATVGANVDVVAGVVNHEYRPVKYRIEITINGDSGEKVDTGTLAHQQKWQDEISFVIQQPGENQKVEFWLYKDDEVEPYLQDPLRLYINAR